MNAFWLVAALMMLVCLAFILVPLSRPRARAGVSAASASMAIHRDRLRELELAHAGGVTSAEAYSAARDDIARQVLADAAAQADDAGPPSAADRGALLGTAMLLPALAMLGYFWLGDVGALNELAAQRAESPHTGTPHGVAEMVARLEARLRVQPEDSGGWVLLGRSQGYLGQHDKAVAAFSRANALEPDNIGIMADLAEAIMMSNGHRIDARARALLDTVLSREPEHPKARLLMSLRPASPSLPLGAPGPVAGALPGGVSAAGALSESRPSGSMSAVSAPTGSTPAVNALKVRVTLAPALRAALPPGATVFVFARAAQGAAMPLAVARRSAGELPFDVTLSDADAVMPGRRLSQAAVVIIGARVSATGSATPGPGDLQGQSGVLERARTASVQVEIDHVRP